MQGGGHRYHLAVLLACTWRNSTWQVGDLLESIMSSCPLPSHMTALAHCRYSIHVHCIHIETANAQAHMWPGSIDFGGSEISAWRFDDRVGRKQCGSCLFLRSCMHMIT
jgi:hypothetical protein